MHKIPRRWQRFLLKNVDSNHGSRFLFFRGMIFSLSPGIYEPEYDSFFFVNNIVARKNEKILDLGTGSGILAIYCARFSSKITAVDSHKVSIECAKTNAYLNNAEKRIVFRQGNWFEPVKNQKFDLILTNPPQQPTPHKIKLEDMVSRAIDAGADGRKQLNKIISESVLHLNAGGRIQIYHNQFSNIKKTIGLVKKVGLRPEITARGRGLFGRTSRERIEYFEDIGVRIKYAYNKPIQEYCVVTAWKDSHNSETILRT